MKNFRRSVAAAEAFMLYLLTGVSCLMVGSSLPQLTEHFHSELIAVTSLVSAFAAGRISTVFFIGLLTEKLGPKRTVGAGLVLLMAYLGGVPSTHSIPTAMVFAVLGGVSMGTQDAACPVILMEVFPNRYASAMSAGQAFFGAGCFLPPLVMGFVLETGRPFYYTYYAFLALGLLMLLILPVMKVEVTPNVPAAAEPGANGKRRLFPLMLFGILCMSYCAAINALNMYAASYAAYRGVEQSRAVGVLTAFNIGCMLGSLTFALVLRRAKPINVLCSNLLAGLFCVGAALFLKSYPALLADFFAAGIFLGVLFSVVLTLAVGLTQGRAGRAGAIVAILSGSADIIAPLVTGEVIMASNLSAGIWFSFAAIAAALIAALCYRRSGRKSDLKADLMEERASGARTIAE